MLSICVYEHLGSICALVLWSALYLRKIQLPPRQKILTNFFCRSFLLIDLSFWSFSSQVCMWWEAKIEVYFFLWTSVFPTKVLEKISLSPLNKLAVLSKINWPYIHVDLFQVFLFYSTDLCVYPFASNILSWLL